LSSVTEQLLSEMADLLAGGGSSARVRGDGLFLVVGSGNTISFTPEGPRRITGVRFNGTNIVVSRNGILYSTMSSAASGFQCHVIAHKDNSSVETLDQCELNVVIIPPEQIWINNNGAGVGTVTLYWDILDGLVFHN